MIRKLLLIGQSGLLQYFLSQDEITINKDLLSGFCGAIYNFSTELAFPLKNIGFENHRMLVEGIKHEADKDDRIILIACLFDDYHIEEGIKKKISTFYNEFFKDFVFGNESVPLNTPALDSKVLNLLNDVPLNSFILQNLKVIKEMLDPIIMEEDNEVYAYSLNTSNNEILYSNANDIIYTYRQGEKLDDIIKGYLRMLKFETTPQGDIFVGWDFPTGLDLHDYVESGQKTHGIVINTSINLPNEPNNEILLYLFGKNTLLRSIIPDIEEQLRNKLQQATETKIDQDLFFQN